jgi:hypothetical protein
MNDARGVLHAELQRRHACAVLLLVAAAAFVHAAALESIRVVLTVLPGSSMGEPTPQTIAWTGQRAGTLEDSLIVGFAIVIFLVALTLVVRPALALRFTMMPPAVAVGALAVLFVRFRETSAIIRGAAASYGLEFPQLRGATASSSSTIEFAIVLTALATILMWTGADPMLPPAGMRRRLSAGVVVALLTAVVALVLSAQMRSSRHEMVSTLQTTATESGLLHVAWAARERCLLDCSLLSLNTVPGDERYPTIGQVPGWVPSTYHDGSVLVSVTVEPAPSGNHTRVGFAALSASGVCVFAEIPDLTSRAQFFGSTDDPAHCKGSEASRRATAALPEMGGWPSLRPTWVWPSAEWSIGIGFHAYTGV